jgi:DNA-binding transcriptional MerR regulator
MIRQSLDAEAVSSLYTLGTMAEVIDAPAAAVRHWRRRGLLWPSRRSGRLEWFDYSQLVVGRRLARLLDAGLSVSDIDRQLERLAPGGAPEAIRLTAAIEIDGRRLAVRRDGLLIGPGGQLEFDFASPPRADEQPPETDIAEAVVIRGDWQRPAGIDCEEAEDDDDQLIDSVDELLDLAADLESGGQFVEAAEALRAVLQAQPATAQVAFLLAEVLYRGGDLTAARERYYMAIELDPDHLEARTNLGCVLAELGDGALAVAALEGVVRQEPEYAEAHWHLAAVLEACERPAESRWHLREFVRLAPASPWAEAARVQLEESTLGEPVSG